MGTTGTTTKPPSDRRGKCARSTSRPRLRLWAGCLFGLALALTGCDRPDNYTMDSTVGSQVRASGVLQLSRDMNFGNQGVTLGPPQVELQTAVGPVKIVTTPTTRFIDMQGDERGFQVVANGSYRVEGILRPKATDPSVGILTTPTPLNPNYIEAETLRYLGRKGG